jgi:hypothetical protein
MLRAELNEELHPGYIYSRRPRIVCEGIKIVATKRSDSLVPRLCRQLIDAGYDPQLPMEVYRNDTLALHVRSLEAAAKITVEETGSGLRFAKYRPFDQSRISDAASEDDV